MAITPTPERIHESPDQPLLPPSNSTRAHGKVLVLSSSFPYPVDIGRKVIMAGFLEYLAATFGPANITFAYIAAEDERPSQAASECRVAVLPLDGLAQRVARAGWQSLLRKRYAFQEMMLYSRRAALQIAELLRRQSPDMVVVDTVRVARYIEEVEPTLGRSVLYLDDLYSLRYRRMLSAMQAHPEMALNCIGTFGRFLPTSVQRIARGQMVQHRLLEIESSILEKREAELSHRFDSVLLLNPDEATRLSRYAQARNIATVKPLLRNNRGRLPRHFDGAPTYVFLGNLYYPANAYSLVLFLERVMPRLVKADSRTQLIVIGRRDPAEWQEHLKRWSGRVWFKDFVENIAPVMAKAAAMIAPMVYGSGLKMKVLDALYHGVPIVSTRFGIDGVPAKDKKECFVEDDLARFVEPLLQLLNPVLNSRMSQDAQLLYAREFAPEVVWNEYREIFGTA